MPQLLKNNVSGVLASELSAVGTSMTLVDATAFPDPGADYYLCTLAGLDSNGREDKWEIVRVTAKASNTLSITRAQESTTNRLWPVGTAVQMRLTAGSVATKDDLTTKQSLDADLTAIAALTGTSGLLKKTAANTWTLDTAAYTTNTGTVTSVGVSVPTGLSVTGSPVTSSGTIVISLASGYSIPTTSKQTNWDSAYGWGNHASAGYSTLALGSTAGAALAASGSAGSATTAAKSDHVHPFPTAANVGAEPSISKSIGFAKWNGSAWTFDNSVYLTSFTESDPTVPSHVKGITTTNVNNWNTAYGWGNHASAGYSTLALGTAAGSPLAASGAAGSATTAAKSDHVHPLPTAANVGAVAASGGAASGLTLNDGYTEEVFTVTGTAPALSPTNGSIQTWTLTGNATPTTGTWASGQSMTLMVDDGAAYTINWASMSITWKTGGGTAPTLLTTGYTVIELAKVGATLYGWLAGDA